MEITYNIKPRDISTDDHYFLFCHGVRHAYEKESFLRWFVGKCKEAGEFISIKTKANEDHLVALGYLEKDGSQTYRLSNRTIIDLAEKFPALKES